jgi:iron complex transport system ATP-binding protein
MTDQHVIQLREVSVRRSGRVILDHLDWTVDSAQHWVVLGENGSGKSTLLRIAGLSLHPSTGTVEVLGETLGRTDVRTLRTRIGVASAALADQIRPQLTASDIVMTAKFGALEPWWHPYSDDDRARAVELLDRMGCVHLADREFRTASSGERQRVLLARSLMTDPGLVLYDEPTAGLDLGGRERLVATLDALARDSSQPPMVLVTHHVEEIPPAFSHAMMLRAGRVVAAGPMVDTLTETNLAATFGLDVELTENAGRWSARVR